MSENRKIPIAQFCLENNKKRTQVYKLLAKHPGLKAQVPGEKECRINLDKWDKILKYA